MPYLFLIFWLQFFGSTTTEKFLLRFDCEWFSNESFFEAEVIQKHQIKAIHVWVSEKKDREIFENERSFLHYVFDPKGNLSKSYKEIQYRNRTDTLTHEYYYDRSGNCIRRVEKQLPFHFTYDYLFENELKKIEIKIDQNNGDTSFVHLFKHRYQDDQHFIEVANETNKAFKLITIQKNSAKQLLMERTSFMRNSSFHERKYVYTENRLTEIIYRQFYNQMKEQKTNFEYKNEVLDYISVTENEQTNYRIGFIYGKNQLIKSIVKREPERKVTSIYRFEYLFED